MMMPLKDLMINYETHPGFPSSTTEWAFNQQALDRFNMIYKNLETGSRPKEWSQLLDIIPSIFDTFRSNNNDSYEDAFISELQVAIESMVKSQIKFYTSCLRSKKHRLFELRSQNKCEIKGAISPLTTSKILELIDPEFRQLLKAASQGKTDRQSLSLNGGSKIRDLIRELNREFKKNGVFDQLSRVNPGPIKVIGAAIELSVPHAEWWAHSDDRVDAPKTLYAHLDESIDNPKAIIYLTEVNETNGPFSYYPSIYENLNLTGMQSLIGRCVNKVGSSQNSFLHDAYADSIRRTSSLLFRDHFMKLPSQFRFNSHFGWEVTPGSDLECFMIKNEVTVIGGRGTFMVFDGAHTVHRGGIVQENYRLAIQVIFGTMGLGDTIRRLLRFVGIKIRS